MDNTSSTTNSDGLDIVCVLDREDQKVFEEVQHACTNIRGIRFHHVEYTNLKLDDREDVNLFYNADVVLVDMTDMNQQHLLSYKLGMRECYGMKQNILLYNVTSQCEPYSIKSLSSWATIFYKVSEEQGCIVDRKFHCKEKEDKTSDTKPVSLGCQIKCLLKDVVAAAKTYKKQKFLDDLCKASERLAGEELSKALHKMKIKLEDPDIISSETVHKMLISFREIQDYTAMIKLVDDLNARPSWKLACTPQIKHLYAFALNRRNGEGDRVLAEKIVTQTIQEVGDQYPELFCLCGRIYKDRFVETGRTDMECLEKSIQWYRKSFELLESEYSGINLATMLMIKGEKFSTCQELQRVTVVLNYLLGQKGNIDTIKDYWSAATYLELSLLTEDYDKAILVAEHIFKLKPSVWHLKTTLNNVKLILHMRNPTKDKAPEEMIFHFWMEFFTKSCEDTVLNCDRFPVLLLQSSKLYLPGYAAVEPGLHSINLSSLRSKVSNEKCDHICDVIYPQDQIKFIRYNKPGGRRLFLCAGQKSDEHRMVFPSVNQCNMFYEKVLGIIKM